MNAAQKDALRLALEGHSFLILGPAGTGKSFILSKIAEECSKIGRNVSLTCTTGISCTVYEERFHPTTIHKWAGIDDGRHSPQELVELVKCNVKYKNVVERIRQTDILIIDECSMLSERMFDSLRNVCSIKNTDLLFGGLQIILCGDFVQLPPVPNVLFNEEGKFCFEHELFLKICPHRVILTDVIRQSEPLLIQAISEISLGKVTDEMLSYMNSLNRPLEDNTRTSVKLFARNDLVDDFNRNSIIHWPGQLVQCKAIDSGERKYLDRILAPKTLWIKEGCPVILLKNLSDKLVNGLQGKVVSTNEKGPTIEFPSIGLTTLLKTERFSGTILHFL